MMNGIRPGEPVEIKNAHGDRVMARLACINYDGRYTFTGEALFNARTPKTTYDDPIGRVIYAPPATIVYWKDGDKTAVKCGPDDAYDPIVGLLMAITKKHFGNTGIYKQLLRSHFPEAEASR